MRRIAAAYLPYVGDLLSQTVGFPDRIVDVFAVLLCIVVRAGGGFSKTSQPTPTRRYSGQTIAAGSPAPAKAAEAALPNVKTRAHFGTFAWPKLIRSGAIAYSIGHH